MSHEVVKIIASPRTVTAPGGETQLLVMDKGSQLPSSFALKATQARYSVAIRIGGGCSNMDDADKRDMVQYFLEAFAGYGGVVFSGGTRQVTELDQIDLLVTELPGFIAEANQSSVALGTIPRTSTMKFKGESDLHVCEYGARINVAMAMVLIVQDGAEDDLDWDGDLDVYFQLMKQWKDYAGFTALGGIFWNGGEVTKNEIIRCANYGFVTILVKGSGRGTDEYIELLESGDEEFLSKVGKNHKIIVVNREDPTTLREALVQNGFLLFKNLS